MGGAFAGRCVPQYPQNLLPTGNDLWHFGHRTWAIVEAPEPRSSGDEAAGVTGVDGAAVFCALPQRRQLGAVAGFMLPQDGQRI